MNWFPKPELKLLCIIWFIIIVAVATVRARTDSVAEVGGEVGTGVGVGTGAVGWGPFRPRGFGTVGVTTAGVG